MVVLFVVLGIKLFSLTLKYIYKLLAITHAYVHWLADVHSGSFAPALASLIFNSLCRSTTANAPANETSRVTVTANAHSLGRYGL